jgi:uncharacterized Zn finger protein (UPF0148 family)
MATTYDAQTQTATTQMVGQTCGECGIVFAVPEWFDEGNRQTGRDWYCPNGHSRVYRDTTEKQLRRANGELSRRLATEQANKEWWQTKQENTERSLRATRGVVTRTKNRIAKGICPCCRRHFVNLAGHMKNEHPNYAVEA